MTLLSVADKIKSCGLLGDDSLSDLVYQIKLYWSEYSNYVVAAKTVLPVLGVPVASTTLGGMDALLSICQMPKGIPVGTLAIGKPGAANAALLAIAILGSSRPELRRALEKYRQKRAEEVLQSDASVARK